MGQMGSVETSASDLKSASVLVLLSWPLVSWRLASARMLVTLLTRVSKTPRPDHVAPSRLRSGSSPPPLMLFPPTLSTLLPGKICHWHGRTAGDLRRRPRLLDSRPTPSLLVKRLL